MFSEARAHRQSHAPRHMHFSLPWKLNFRSRADFLNPKQRSNRKYVALFYLWRNVAIRLSKSISKFCMSTFKPLRKALHPALPKAPLFRCWAGSARSQVAGAAPASPTRPAAGPDLPAARDGASSETERPLRMSARLDYLLISYYITEKESEKKTLPTCPKRKRKGKL